MGSYNLSPVIPFNIYVDIVAVFPHEVWDALEPYIASADNCLIIRKPCTSISNGLRPNRGLTRKPSTHTVHCTENSTGFLFISAGLMKHRKTRSRKFIRGADVVWPRARFLCALSCQLCQSALNLRPIHGGIAVLDTSLRRKVRRNRLHSPARFEAIQRLK